MPDKVDFNAQACVRWGPFPAGREFARGAGERDFSSLAGAVRFVAELPEESRPNAWIDSDAKSFDLEAIMALYKRPDFPLR